MDTNRLQPAGARRPLIRRGAVELGAALGLALTVLLTAALWYGEQTRAAVCADTLRLHILANSNSVDDQLLKLKVRDAVLEEMPAILQNAATKQEAETAVSGALWRLAAGGAAHRPPRRQQPDGAGAAGAGPTLPPGTTAVFRLPAGEYTALRIELGAAAGHNWFCVLYPELCVGASQGPLRHPRRERPGVRPVRGALRFVGRAAAPGRLGGRGGVRPPHTPRAGADVCIRPPPGLCGGDTACLPPIRLRAICRAGDFARRKPRAAASSPGGRERPPYIFRQTDGKTENGRPAQSPRNEFRFR